MLPKLTRTQWINVLAAIPAIYSLWTLFICLCILAVFAMMLGGWFIAVASVIALVGIGMVLANALLKRR
jgi:NADH:ubiquinone oxidoreductase subunit 6 (subunit J)